MKLIECYIENFGKLSKFSYHFADGMNVFCHENGWGKSTFAGFIKAMFYGLPASRSTDIQQNERARFTPWQGGNFGGTLTFSIGGETYRVERYFGQKESQDTFALFDCKTGRSTDAYSSRLGEELFDIDAIGYERSTYISEKLTVDEKADYTGIQAKLVDMNDISDFNIAVKRLEERRRHYYLNGGKGAIAETTAKLARCRTELEEAKTARQKTNELNRRVRELDHAREICEQKIQAARARTDTAVSLREERALNAHRSDLESKVHRTREAVSTCRAYLSGNLPTPAALNEQAQTWRTLQDMRLPEIPHSRIPAPLPYILGIFGACIIAAGAALGVFVLSWLFSLIAVGAISVLIGVVCGFSRNAVKQTALSVKAAHAEYDRLKATLNAFLEGFPIVLADTRLTNDGERLWAIREKMDELRRAQEEAENAENELNAFRKSNPDIFSELSPREHTDKTQAEEEIAALQKTVEEIRLERDKCLQDCALYAAPAARYTACEQEIANLEEQKKAQEKSLEIIKLTQQYLETARTALSSRYLNNIQLYFRSYMRILTEVDMQSKFSDEYESEAYTVTSDFRVNITKFGKTRAAATLSRGGRDLVALCLRFAITDALFEGKKPPLILDDPFINLDDDKITAAMALLRRVAEGRQIFYISCHSSRM